MTLSALAPWGVVGLLCLGLIESYRLAALWDEQDFEKRTYPGARVCLHAHAHARPHAWHTVQQRVPAHAPPPCASHAPPCRSVSVSLPRRQAL
jgi:hypothetical protein